MKVAKWEEFQGYKKTGPAWIKLYTGLIDKPEWLRLPMAAKAVLPYLWIAAAKAGSDGELPDEPELLSTLCHLSEVDVRAALPALIASGFLVCDKTVATSATEVSGEERRERVEESREEPASSLAPSTPDFSPIENLWKSKRGRVSPWINDIRQLLRDYDVPTVLYGLERYLDAHTHKKFNGSPRDFVENADKWCRAPEDPNAEAFRLLEQGMILGRQH